MRSARGGAFSAGEARDVRGVDASVAAWHRFLRFDPGLPGLLPHPVPALARSGEARVRELALDPTFFGHRSRALMFAGAVSLDLALRNPARPADVDDLTLVATAFGRFARQYPLGVAPARVDPLGAIAPYRDLHNGAASKAVRQFLRGPALHEVRELLGGGLPERPFDVAVLDVGLPALSSDRPEYAGMVAQHVAGLPSMPAGAGGADFLTTLAANRHRVVPGALDPRSVATIHGVGHARPLMVVPVLLALNLHSELARATLAHEYGHTQVDFAVPGLHFGRLLDEVLISVLAGDSTGYSEDCDDLRELTRLTGVPILGAAAGATRDPAALHFSLCAGLGPRVFLRLMDLGTHTTAGAAEAAVSSLLSAAARSDTALRPPALRDVLHGTRLGGPALRPATSVTAASRRP